jgi:hypothetical protein
MPIAWREGGDLAGSLDYGGLIAQEAMHMGARWAAASADRDDVLDLGQRQAEAGRLLDEAEHLDRVVAVEAIAGWGALRPRQDSFRS